MCSLNAVIARASFVMLSRQVAAQTEELVRLKAQADASAVQSGVAPSAAVVSLERSGALPDLMTRGDVSKYLRVCMRTVQRMESSRTLRRCPGLGTLVRYASRDVLRLASAR